MRNAETSHSRQAAGFDLRVFEVAGAGLTAKLGRSSRKAPRGKGPPKGRSKRSGAVQQPKSDHPMAVVKLPTDVRTSPSRTARGRMYEYQYLYQHCQYYLSLPLVLLHRVAAVSVPACRPAGVSGRWLIPGVVPVPRGVRSARPGVPQSHATFLLRYHEVLAAGYYDYYYWNRHEDSSTPSPRRLFARRAGLAPTIV